MQEQDLNSTPLSDDGGSALSSLRLVNGVFEHVDQEQEAEAQDQEKRDRFRETVKRFATPDRLHALLLMVYRRTGRALKVTSLEIGEDDPDFREACDLLYDDLEDSVFGDWIDTLSGPAIERLIVYGVGFGGPFVGAYREVQNRKRESDDTPKSDDMAVTVEDVENVE